LHTPAHTHTGAISCVLEGVLEVVCEIVVCMQMKIFNAGGAFSILQWLFMRMCLCLPVCVFEILI